MLCEQWLYLLEEGISNIAFFFYRFQPLGLLSGQGFPAGPTTSVVSGTGPRLGALHQS